MVASYQFQVPPTTKKQPKLWADPLSFGGLEDLTEWVWGKKQLGFDNRWRA
jgi:hypothetical protein